MKENVLILGHNYATQFIDIFNQYTRLFDDKKYAVTVIYLSGAPNEEVKKRTLAKEVIFLNIPTKNLRGLKLSTINQLLKICKTKQFKIAIGHRYKPSYCLMWLNLFHRIPKLYFVMHELATMSSWKRQFLIALLKRKNMLFAGVSNAVRDDMRKNLWWLPKKQIQTLYNVIDIEMTEPQFLTREEARATYGISPDTFVFGNVARLAKNKDQHNLIHAFADLHKKNGNTKLIIMGEGELEASLKEQTRQLGLEDAVIFTGFVHQAHRFMRAFDCFVLSSIQEAFGRVLLEAMLAHLPVIATRVNGIPEVLGDTGLLVKPNNIVELSSAMQKIYLMSQTDRQKQINKARQHLDDHFSLPAFSDQFWQTTQTLFPG